MIILKNVRKSYKKNRVLTDISLKIDPGEFVCITGPSGAGKTTFVHILAGAEDATSGSVEVDGIDLKTIPPAALMLYRRRVGVIFQDGKLLPHMTVRENVTYPLEVCGASDKEIQSRSTLILRKMNLTKRANALPHELSAGEKARTAIARAVAHSPMILIADEPTGNLDPDESLQILNLLQDINKDGTTVVLATHDASLVDAANTRVIRFDNGRITRDSEGGYHRTTKQAKKHNILSQESAKEAAVQPKAVAESRKVKVTAVNS